MHSLTHARSQFSPHSQKLGFPICLRCPGLSSTVVCQPHLRALPGTSGATKARRARRVIKALRTAHGKTTPFFAFLGRRDPCELYVSADTRL
eukprot:1868415-Pleurochrysis_carterae.AAC.1